MINNQFSNSHLSHSSENTADVPAISQHMVVCGSAVSSTQTVMVHNPLLRAKFPCNTSGRQSGGGFLANLNTVPHTSCLRPMYISHCPQSRWRYRRLLARHACSSKLTPGCSSAVREEWDPYDELLGRTCQQTLRLESSQTSCSQRAGSQSYKPLQSSSLSLPNPS